MSFTENEVYVGMIAYFIIDELRAEETIRHTGGTANGDHRPFVCYARDAQGDLHWTPLTLSTGQPNRATLDKAYLARTGGKFKSEQVLVSDGAHTYVGAAAVFAKLSHSADNYTATNRPDLTQEGISFVQSIVASRGGPVP